MGSVTGRERRAHRAISYLTGAERHIFASAVLTRYYILSVILTFVTYTPAVAMTTVAGEKQHRYTDT